MKPLRLFALVLVPTFAVFSSARADEEASEKLYQRVVKSCVFIVTPIGDIGYAMGSGSLIDAERKLVLTNWHVVDENKAVYIQFPMLKKDGSVIVDKPAYINRAKKREIAMSEVLYRDKSRDLAIVRAANVPSGTPALPIVRKSAAVGTTTWNIGSPGAVTQVFSITEGKVRAVGQEKFPVGGGDGAFFVNARVLQSTNPTNPGDSGGPLFNKDGHIVAVTESGSRANQQVNNFIDALEVRAFLKEFAVKWKDIAPGEDDPELKTDPASKDKPPAKGLVEGTDPQKEKDAASLLRRSKTFAEGDTNRPEYIKRLKEVSTKFPGTAAAKEAEKILKGLDK